MAAGSPTVVVAQSHPSSPRVFTAFTRITIPALTSEIVACARVTLIIVRDGSLAGPNPTINDVMPASGLAVHDSDAVVPRKLSTFSRVSRDGLDAGSISVATVVLLVSAMSWWFSYSSRSLA
jgi:hypothetical protein